MECWRISRKLVNFVLVVQKRVASTSTISSRNISDKIMKSVEEVPHSYHDAIAKLNSLQSNAITRAHIAADLEARNKTSLSTMMECIETIGLSKEDLASLNTIHVTGSKGKGTTCAFTESMLRKMGLRTGFYSSPHLIVVRERIRIDGIPISRERFTKYFFAVYNRLIARKEKEPEFIMPAYFRFLTCMAFYTFLQEKVDVAIFEVGIGGRYDCTNIIPNPTVVGITSIGLEHQAMLGTTLEEIAWAKGGIIKPKCSAFTVYNQKDSVLNVIQDCAKESNVNLTIVPKLSKNAPITLGVDDGDVTRINSALAVQLCNAFLRQKFPEKLASKEICSGSQMLSPTHIKGLEETIWPGRFQRIEKSELLVFYLDGAHTKESLTVSLEWFKNASCLKAFRVLIFNVTGDRGSNLVTPFSKSDIFDLALFCPVLRRGTTPNSDNWNVLSHGADVLTSCKKHADAWRATTLFPAIVLDSTDASIDFVTGLSNNSTKAQHIELCNNLSNGESTKQFDLVQVLVTGSLHLVGNILSILDPSLDDE